MKPTSIRSTLLGLSVIAMTLGMSSNRANAQATLTAYYTFEGGTPGDASDTTNYFDSAPGGTADHLTGFFQPELSPTVTGNARGSAQSAVFDGSSKLRTDSYSTDLGPDLVERLAERLFSVVQASKFLIRLRDPRPVPLALVLRAVDLLHGFGACLLLLSLFRTEPVLLHSKSGDLVGE